MAQKTNVYRSPLLKHPGTQEQNHSTHQNLFGEPRRISADTKMIEDIGNDLKDFTLGKKSSEKASEKAMLSKSLKKANNAVQLDNAQDFRGARSAYREACDLLHQVVLRTRALEDKTKLEAIVSLH